MKIITCFYIFIHREKIKIPHNKPYIILKGEKKKETKVIWDDHYTVAQSPTFTSIADNIIVKSMSFVVRHGL